MSLGYNVLIPYLRGHGLSEGKYLSFGALDVSDIKKWVDKINEIMNGGIVLNLSNSDMENVRCLISDAPSVSIRSFFENVSKEVFKSNSNKIASFAIKRFKKEFNLDVDEFESINIVSKSKYPILLSAGSNEHLFDLFETIKNVNKFDTDIIILPGCNHGNGMYKQTELYQNKIKEFINKYI